MELIFGGGSANSSNSNRLVEVAKRAGVPARLIEDANDIDASWVEGIKTIGLTAGASAPEILVEQVSQRLSGFGFTNHRDLGSDSRRRAVYASAGTGRETERRPSSSIDRLSAPG